MVNPSPSPPPPTLVDPACGPDSWTRLVYLSPPCRALKMGRCSKSDQHILFSFFTQCYYPHTSSKSVSPVCEIFFLAKQIHQNLDSLPVSPARLFVRNPRACRELLCMAQPECLIPLRTLLPWPRSTLWRKVFTSSVSRTSILSETRR